MSRVCLCLILCVAGMVNLFAQNVHSIIVDSHVEVTCTSMKQYVERGTATITILDENGLSAGIFVCHCDDFFSLLYFSGEIYDADGNFVREIKKSDLQKNEYSSALLSDSYQYYYRCKHSSYPFTIKYKWKRKCHKGVIGFPTFIPQHDYNQLVQKASYKITLPSEQKCRHYGENLQGLSIVVRDTVIGTKQVVEVQATSLSPIQKEPYAPAAAQLFPVVRFAPSVFQYGGTTGRLDSWETYGQWQYGLLQGRSELPSAFSSKLHQLVAGCTTDYEKIARLYDYLARSTRYVSIQLGIGGLQPAFASEVYRLGFGDCKALSLFMYAMLKEIGISSVYTIVSTENKCLIPCFASADQMNHVILQVPLSEDTLWLECTNPNLPLGYVHQSIAGHDALLITSDGGSVCRLPNYPDSLNSEHISAQIELDKVNMIQGKVRRSSRLFRYEVEKNMLSLPIDDQYSALLSQQKGPRSQITDCQVNEVKDRIPIITFDYMFTMEKNASNRGGNRFFFPVNVFRKGTSFFVQKRKYPIVIQNGYVNSDTIIVKVPDNYIIEHLPPKKIIENRFGCFISDIVWDGKIITIVQRLHLKRGEYSQEYAECFFQFLNEVGKLYDDYFVFKMVNL